MNTIVRNENGAYELRKGAMNHPKKILTHLGSPSTDNKLISGLIKYLGFVGLMIAFLFQYKVKISSSKKL